MERLSPKEFVRRWFGGSFAFFGYVSSILSSMSAVVGFYLAAHPSQNNSLMATIFFALSILILIGALVVGFFVAPYRIVQERDREAIIRRMSDGIQRTLRELDGLCNAITRSKGEKDVPLKSHRDLLENTHDSIRDSVMKNLNSLLPKEE